MLACRDTNWASQICNYKTHFFGRLAVAYKNQLNNPYDARKQLTGSHYSTFGKYSLVRIWNLFSFCQNISMR